MFLFCKTILYSGNCRIFRDLAFGSIKTRFKAILKSWIFRPRSTCRSRLTFFMNFCPRRATKLRSLWCRSLKIQSYNVHYIYIYIILFMYFFTKRNLAQYPHRSALQAPYFACAEIWWIAMFLAYQRASRPYKRLVFLWFYLLIILHFFDFFFCLGSFVGVIIFKGSEAKRTSISNLVKTHTHLSKNDADDLWS